VEEEEERLVASRAQPLDRAVERLARAEDVGLRQVAEEEAAVEDERPDVVPVRAERAEEGLGRRVERRVPVQVAVVVRIEARDHRGHRGRRPRRGADRLLVADTARGELVDRRGAQEARAVAAEMVDAQRVRDVDEDVHGRGRL
jgi:hypothetical protein